MRQSDGRRRTSSSAASSRRGFGPLRVLDYRGHEPARRRAVRRAEVGDAAARPGARGCRAASARRWRSPARGCPNPKIVLMDEPTAAITVRQVAEVLNLIRRLRDRASPSCSSATACPTCSPWPTASSCCGAAPRWPTRRSPRQPRGGDRASSPARSSAPDADEMNDSTVDAILRARPSTARSHGARSRWLSSQQAFWVLARRAARLSSSCRSPPTRSPRRRTCST